MRLRQSIPVILDTDLGTDIDDHWAVAMLLNSPELDVRLITAGSGDTLYRAGLLAAFLDVAGCSSIPIGVGRPTSLPSGVPLRVFGNGEPPRAVEHHPAFVSDAAEAMVSTVRNSASPITIISIGPLTNLADALGRDPRITANSRVISMSGFLHGGILGATRGPQSEYNVEADVASFRKVLASSWDLTLVPVDVCGQIRLRDHRYRAVATCPDPMLRALMQIYRCWTESDAFRALGLDPDNESSALFDTLPVYLAYATDLVAVERISVDVTQNGVVAECVDGHYVDAVTSWVDFEGFLDHLVARLTSLERS